MRTQFLALSLVLITSCVTPQAYIPPGRTVNFTQYRAAKLVVVDSVNTPFSKEGIPMFEGLLRGRFQSLGFSVVEKDEDLKIEVNITSFESGSRAARLIVGFGAGRAVLTYRAIFKERSGAVIAEFAGGKSYHGGELTLKENSMFMTDEEITMGMIQQSVIQVGEFIEDNSLQVAPIKLTLVNPKTGESVTCPWEGLVTRSITAEQAAQQRAWHAEFQRTHNRLPTPMEGCLKEYEISGFVRAATEEPL
jgi:hypothetical protein